MEPDKYTEWDWFKVNNLPQPLFLPVENLLKQKVL
jgi:8-oxo-dGTP diphosphatase